MLKLFEATEDLHDEIAITSSNGSSSDTNELRDRIFDISTIVGLMIEEDIMNFTPEEIDSYTAQGMEALREAMQEKVE